MKFKRQPDSAGKDAIKGSAAYDPDAGALFGALVDWLTQTLWDDGAKRKTGTVMILAEDGVFKAWLHDRDASRSCWLSGGTLTDLAGKIEETLSEGKGEWRADRKGR